MKVKLSILAAAALAATFGLSGCGGNEDPSSVVTSTPTPSAAVTGVAVDGYIANGNICVDINNSEDSCEWTGKTDAAGGYSIPAEYASGKIIITGGTDLDTGMAFGGMLKAPAGSAVVSPLTTLLADGMPASTIAAILGISETDVTKDFRASGAFDPEVAVAAQKVQAIIGQIYATFASQSTLSDAEIMNLVVDTIAANVTTADDLTTDQLEGSTLPTIIAQLDIAITDVSLSNEDITSLATTITTTAVDLDNLLATGTVTEADLVSTVQTIALENPLPLVNGVYVKNNNVTIGGVSVQFDNKGVVPAVNVPAATAATDMNITMQLQNVEGITTTPKTINIGILVDDTASTRELKAILMGATIAFNNAGNIVVAVPATAVLYAEAKGSDGALYTATLTNSASDSVSADSQGNITVNLSDLTSRIESKVSGTAFANLTEVGSYAVSFYVGGMPLGFDDTSADVPVLSAPVETLSVMDGTKSMTGTKFFGNISVVPAP